MHDFYKRKKSIFQEQLRQSVTNPDLGSHAQVKGRQRSGFFGRDWLSGDIVWVRTTPVKPVFFWCGKRGPRPTSSTSQQRISPNFATTHESIYILHSKHIERDFQKFATKTSKLKHVKHVKQAPYCDHFTAHCTAEMFIPPCSEGTGSFSHLVSFLYDVHGIQCSNSPILCILLIFPIQFGEEKYATLVVASALRPLLPLRGRCVL